MDIPKIFIKMCEKAEEIQALEPGSFSEEGKHKIIACLEHGDVFNEDNGYYYSYCDCKGVWLPTQSQLQAMVGDYYACLRVILSEDWWENGKSPLEAFEHTYSDSFTSMEQLWLAFVMYQKYDKVWQDEEWVKVKMEV